MTRVDARARCRHGVPVRDFCSRCVSDRLRPAEIPMEHRGVSELAVDLAAARVRLEPEALNLPPLGQHSAVLSRARGHWTITCSGCPGFRVRGADRHDVETAWGRHRNS